MGNEWLQDVVGVIGLVAAAIGACVLAVVIARQSRLEAVLRRWGGEDAPEPRVVIAMLAECAEVARKQGLLALEGFVAQVREPILARGVSLAVEARTPEEIRDALHAEVEALAARRAGAAASLGTVALCIRGVGLAALTAVVVGASVLVVAGPEVLPAPGLLMGAGMAVGVLAGVGGGILGMRGERAQAGNVLAGLLIAEGVALIRAGQDGWTVERALARLLPDEPQGAALARAA
jgi:chemotaxis protein MotA